MGNGRKWYLVDVTIPQDHHAVIKEDKKVDTFLELTCKAQPNHNVKVKMISKVIESMGMIAKNLKKYIGPLDNSHITGKHRLYAD